MKLATCFSSCLLIVSMLGSLLTYGQATRTWVSGVGDDVNPCSRTAPCKTFAGAISKTAVGGEINVLDAGGYGAVTITKAITINGGGSFGSILSSSTNGIIINAGDATVTLRNLDINGAGTTLGINGIRILAAKQVNIENLNMANFSERGVEVISTTATTVLMNNVTIHNAKEAVSLTTTGGSLIVNDCTFQSFRWSAINIKNGSAIINNSVISGADTAVVAQMGSLSSVHLSGNLISNNRIGIQGPGKITSSGNNSIINNGSPGITPVFIKQQ